MKTKNESQDRGVSINHNETLAAGLPVKTAVKSGSPRDPQSGLPTG